MTIAGDASATRPASSISEPLPSIVTSVHFEASRICPSIRSVRASGVPLAATPATLNGGNAGFPLTRGGPPSLDGAGAFRAISSVALQVVEYLTDDAAG